MDLKPIFINVNILSLSNLFIVLFQLLTYPLIIKKYGLNLMGILIFSQNIFLFLNLIINGGLNIIGLRVLNIFNTSYKKNKVNELLSSIIIIKVFLSILLYILITIFLIIANSKEFYLLYYLSFLIIIGEVFNFNFFYQNTNKFKFVSILNIISKTLSTISVFIFLKFNFSFVFLPFISNIGIILYSCMILYNLRKFHNFHFFIPKFKTVLKYFKLGNKFLLSNISTVALNYLSKLLIGIYISPSSLVSYDFFEKILNFLKGIISNIEQVILPILIKNKSVKKLNFYLKITILVFLFLVSIFIINSNSLTILFLGVEIDKPYLNSFIILVSIIPFIFSTFYCHIYLLAWKYDNKFFQIKYTSFLFYLVVLFFMFFINKNNLYYITLTYEILIALYSFYIFNSLNKYKLNEIY
jgi:PST family polysaccharide transporter